MVLYIKGNPETPSEENLDFGIGIDKIQLTGKGISKSQRSQNTPGDKSSRKSERNAKNEK